MLIVTSECLQLVQALINTYVNIHQLRTFAVTYTYLR